MPWLSTFDASVSAVNQGGQTQRRGCVYLEPWHPDIEEFLELRDNTGEDARRTHNLNLANWIPDLFMRRVEADGVWSLFDPQSAGAAGPLGRRVRRRLSRRGGRRPYVRQVHARDLYARMMRTLAADRQRLDDLQGPATRYATRPREPGNVVHLSNLCTEIIEVTTSGDRGLQPRVGQPCRAPDRGRFDWEKLRHDRTDRGHLPRPGHRHQLLSERQAASFQPALAARRPGVMGLQDVFFELRLPFDSPRRGSCRRRSSEEIYFAALEPPGARRASMASSGVRGNPRREGDSSSTSGE